jgi:hypothetical protein
VAADRSSSRSVTGLVVDRSLVAGANTETGTAVFVGLGLRRGCEGTL